MKLYKVSMISRIADWDCDIKITATSKREARQLAVLFMAAPSLWLVTKVELVRCDG